MRFDGTSYTLDTLLVRGTATPQPATHHVDRPIVDGTILLLDEAGSFADLTPLFASATSPAGGVRCVQFEGILEGADSGGGPIVKYSFGHGGDEDLPNPPPIRGLPFISGRLLKGSVRCPTNLERMPAPPDGIERQRCWSCY